MKRVLIGHRGVGKTALLLRHAQYFPEIIHLDLDREIEKQTSCSVNEIFQKNSETEFRKLEKTIFERLTEKNSDYVVALGAGFEINTLEPDIDVVFIRRKTDKDGRIFLDRPRLEPEMDALTEYKKRYEARDNLFLTHAARLYDMPEGITEVTKSEQLILTENFMVSDAFYTLSRQDLRSLDSIVKTYKCIELRTDLLSEEVILGILSRYPQPMWLVSIRSEVKGGFAADQKRDVDTNYYIEDCQIISSHAENIDLGINLLSGYSHTKTHLKLCPIVENFYDLEKGHRWQQADSQNRSFLPRSSDGKWIWFRQYSKYLQKLNFVKSFAFSVDQPSLSEWLLLPAEKPVSWAALLGERTHFSRSPLIHSEYFINKASFFTAVSVSIPEFNHALSFLIELGLTYAAVTSPLKEKAFWVSGFKTETALALKSANTFFVKNKKIFSHNTDLAGFEALAQKMRTSDAVAVWGGGGTLNMLTQVLPEAHFFSSRTGKLRDSSVFPLKRYEYLVWAAPRVADPVWPGDQIEIGEVVDLNYTENSAGLEFAALRKLRYKNGLEMLLLQAEKQQEFWSDCERK